MLTRIIQFDVVLFFLVTGNWPPCSRHGKESEAICKYTDTVTPTTKAADHDVPVTPDEVSHAFNIFPLVILEL
jgi:hypothetical protein